MVKSFRTRYYLYTRSYGRWRQVGYTDGYKTISELKKLHHYRYAIQEGIPWKITKRVVVQAGRWDG